MYGKDANLRLRSFKDRIRFGPSFPCITCHQTLFKNQVIVFDEKLKEALKQECDEFLFERALPCPSDIFYINIKEETTQTEPSENEHKIRFKKTNRRKQVPNQITIMRRQKKTPYDGGHGGNISTTPSPG